MHAYILVYIKALTLVLCVLSPIYVVTRIARFVDKLEFVHPRASNIDIAEIADEIDDVMESWSTRKYEVYLT